MSGHGREILKPAHSHDGLTGRWGEAHYRGVIDITLIENEER
jgi:hypothetical protein